MLTKNLYSALKIQAKHVLSALSHVRVRLRYPYALPSDIGRALGLSVHDSVLYPSLLSQLSHIKHPDALLRLMPRKQAESCFLLATRCERFTTSTLYSYRFNEGWVEFELEFDEENRLRRLFLIHKEILNADRIEIALRMGN